MSSAAGATDVETSALVSQLIREQASPLFAYQPDGTVVYANASYDDLTRKRFPDGTVGENVFDVVDSGDDRSIETTVEASLKTRPGDDSIVEEIPTALENGEVVWFEWRSSAAFDDAGNVTMVLVVGRDITEQRNSHFTAMHAMERLVESNRDLLEFAQVASHDLQEPLRKVVAFGNRLETHLGDELDDKGADYLARMNGAAVRMQALINDLLTFARVTTRGTPMQVTSLDGILDSVMDDLEITIAESGAVIEADHLPQLPVDASQIGQLFQNLISNSIKFRQDGLAPYISIDAEHVLPETFGGNEPPMGWFDITVSDNGIGFEEKFATKIFAPFQRLHGRSEYAGTGVGLSVCRRIVERHNGTIRAFGRPGVGTSFMIRLPTAHFNETSIGEIEPSAVPSEPESTIDQQAA